MSARLSLVEKARRLHQSEFVGRKEQLKLFRDNLRLDPEDERFHNIFYVYGQGGVGKTSLLRQFQTIAKSFNSLTAFLDVEVQDIPHAMGLIAEQLENQGSNMDEFKKRYQLYQQKKLELESDIEAPKGFAALIGRVIARGGLHAVNKIPGAGVAKEFYDEDQIINLAGEWASHVARKISNKDDLKLLVDPVKVLSHLFFQSLSQISEHSIIILFIDTFEKTGLLLEEWLLSLLGGAFGDVPINLMIVVSGQNKYEAGTWGSFSGITMVIPLETFTPAEAREYLAKKNITNPEITEAIINISHCLPLLVAIIAEIHPRNLEDIGDQSDTAIGRFLKWVDDPLKKQIALRASLPRQIDKDLLRVVAGEEQLDAQFQWLKSMPFIREQNGKWTYHSIAKDAMQRSLRHESRIEWSRLHENIKKHYENCLKDLGLTEEAGWQNTLWCSYALEALYHSLSAHPFRDLPKAINLFVRLLNSNYFIARDVANIIVEAGHSTETRKVIDWGQKLIAGLDGSENYQYSSSILMFSDIVKYPHLESELLWIAYGWRAEHYRLSEHFAEALGDFNHAIELNPDNASMLASRGEILRRQEYLSAALKDFDRAIALHPQYIWALTRRAELYRRIHKEHDAIEELTRVLEINPEYQRALADRGSILRELHRYNLALQDLNHCLSIHPDYVWALSERGELYRRTRKYVEAAQDFSRALELDPSNYWTLTRLSEVYREQKNFDQAIEGFNKAIGIKPTYTWALAGRGETYRLMKQYQLALEDFNRALAVNPDFLWAIEKRGMVYHKLGEDAKGLYDFDRVIRRFDKNPDLIAKRGSSLKHLGRHQEALKDFQRASELDPNNEWLHYQIGLLTTLLGDPEIGNQHFQKAIELADCKIANRPNHERIKLQAVLYKIAHHDYQEDEQLPLDLFKTVETVILDEFLYNLDQYISMFPDDITVRAFQDWVIHHCKRSAPNI